ncbi:hypothetical protein [Crateriforma conspicua]|uniref:hypothetical protein n=1 Tax=Crateriforma conspicua TaxID=2527996 RepID=UPI001188C0F6|nr:hypothetical protein [Crateriforma conspicua]QDV62629.1 hypothetical protein Mal65_17630 [Crateriforma conspicua]
MKYINNNTSIHQTPARMPARTRGHEGVTDELRYCGILNQPEPSCWDCRFFDTSPLLDRDQPPEEECQQGECRRLPPVCDHGNREASVNYALFPIVIACDWCGEFRPRLASFAITDANAELDAAAHEDATDAAVVAVCVDSEPLPGQPPTDRV